RPPAAGAARGSSRGARRRRRRRRHPRSARSGAEARLAAGSARRRPGSGPGPARGGRHPDGRPPGGGRGGVGTPAPRRAPRPGGADAGEGCMTRPAILVVDDEAPMRALVAARLRARGYEVLAAADGREALELVAERRPELLLLDLDLPGPERFALLAAVRCLT